uniref:Uncharacterized protein n=1 Tax=Rousettus aegyptiacus TaxID=9407 RepID=A0A7J8F060_ROUAE|nr:hypothetical protein HJG63_012225 [Rousettus aegyptiacus]
MSHTVRNAPTTVRSAGPGIGGTRDFWSRERTAEDCQHPPPCAVHQALTKNIADCHVLPGPQPVVANWAHHLQHEGGFLLGFLTTIPHTVRGNQELRVVPLAQTRGTYRSEAGNRQQAFLPHPLSFPCCVLASFLTGCPCQRTWAKSLNCNSQELKNDT